MSFLQVCYVFINLLNDHKIKSFTFQADATGQLGDASELPPGFFDDIRGDDRRYDVRHLLSSDCYFLLNHLPSPLEHAMTITVLLHFSLALSCSSTALGPIMMMPNCSNHHNSHSSIACPRSFALHRTPTEQLNFLNPRPLRS
jgi:hypothetical protein